MTRVEPGVVKDQLNSALAEHGYFFAPELSTSNRATIGGMINTDASGQGSCLYGKTRDHVIVLTSVYSDGTVWTSHALSDAGLEQAKSMPGIVGEIHRAVDALQQGHARDIERHFPKLNRCLTGYDLAHIRGEDGSFNLNALICGSEGTLAVVAEAKVGILPIPKHTALVNISYEDFGTCLRDARALMRYGAASIETVDSRVLLLAQEDIVWEGVQAFFPAGDGKAVKGVNLVEFVGATAQDVEAPIARLTEALAVEGGPAGRIGFTIARGDEAVQRIWGMRKRAVGLLGNMKGDMRPIPFVEDTAVPPEHLADYIEEFRALLDARGLEYGMFGHVDAGVLHVRPAIDMKDPAQERLIRDITDAVAALTVKYGGLLWGEHGKGVRSEYSPLFFGALYPLTQRVKMIFDPREQFNRGKIAALEGSALMTVDGTPTRGGLDRRIPLATRQAFPDVINCNGNGACYDWDPDTAMCPSWKATRERRHSPKGRAMLTKEWLRRLAEQGSDMPAAVRTIRRRSALSAFPARVLNSLPGSRRREDFSHVVKEAMDGCLACKSCVGGCPIKVNVPGFRAQFLELYHSRYLRPAKDLIVAALERLLPVLAIAPALANAVAGTRPAVWSFRRLGLVDLPRLTGIRLADAMAARGFAFATRDRLAKLSPEERERSVVLVQDAFTSYYETDLVLDTLELLARLGFRPFLSVYRPNGKPLHVHGFLRAFERAARRHAQALSRLAETGVPLVGIDPSMTLVYRSEYVEALRGESVPDVHLLQEWLATRMRPQPCLGDIRYALLPHCTERSRVETQSGY